MVPSEAESIEQLRLPGLFGFDGQQQESCQEKYQRNRTAESWVARLVWAACGPIIVMPGYTDRAVPERLSGMISLERLIIARGEEDVGSDAEAMWYLSTASLVAPLDNHWHNIYMGLTRQYALSEQMELPDFLEKEVVLDEYMEARQLRHFKGWLYQKSFLAVKERLRKGADSGRVGSNLPHG